MAEGGDWESGRGRGLPFGKPVQRQPLRQPMNSGFNATHTNLAGNQVISGPSDETIQSPSAAQFHCANATLLRDCQVPEQQQKPSSQPLSPLAAEFVPRTNNCHQPAPMRQPLEEVVSETADHVNGMMTVLAMNPGQFDLYVPAFFEMVSACIYSNELMKTVTNTIFDKSVNEPNLRYNGARLCNYLSENLTSDSSEKIFRQHLLSRCQEEFEKRETTVRDSRKASWLHGLVHFIGELFIHLQVGGEGSPKKCGILATALCQFLELLLSNPSEDNAKCAGQVLKFAGATLEEELRCSSNHNFDKVMEKLKDVAHNNNISRLIKDMLLKIIELRTSNWGRVTSSPVLKEEPFMGDFPCGDPVLYGPDGQPISTEETQFLESNQYLYEADEDYVDFTDFGQGEVWSTEDDQMDDEIADAYEEFLAQQGNNETTQK